MSEYRALVINIDDTHTTATSLAHWPTDTYELPVKENLAAIVKNVDRVDLSDWRGAQRVSQIL